MTALPITDDELVERLRRGVHEYLPRRTIGQCVNPDGNEAADRILSLKAERDELIEALTPSADTKADYIGEFSFTFEDADDEWGLPVTRRIHVPWTTIKEIMAAIKARVAISRDRPNATK